MTQKNVTLLISFSHQNLTFCKMPFANLFPLWIRDTAKQLTINPCKKNILTFPIFCYLFPHEFHEACSQEQEEVRV